MVYYPSGVWSIGGSKVIGGSAGSVGGSGYREVNTSPTATYPKGVWTVAGEKVVGGSPKSVAGVSSQPVNSPTAGQIVKEVREQEGQEAPITKLAEKALSTSPQARATERTVRQAERLRYNEPIFRGLPVSESGNPPKEPAPNPFLNKLTRAKSIIGRAKNEVAYYGGVVNYSKRYVEKGTESIFKGMTDFTYLPIRGANLIEGYRTKKGASYSDVEGVKRGVTLTALSIAPNWMTKPVIGFQSAVVTYKTIKEPSPSNVADLTLTSIALGSNLKSNLKNAVTNTKVFYYGYKTGGILKGFRDVKLFKQLTNPKGDIETTTYTTESERMAKSYLPSDNIGVTGNRENPLSSPFKNLPVRQIFQTRVTRQQLQLIEPEQQTKTVIDLNAMLRNSARRRQISTNLNLLTALGSSQLVSQKQNLISPTIAKTSTLQRLRVKEVQLKSMQSTLSKVISKQKQGTQAKQKLLLGLRLGSATSTAPQQKTIGATVTKLKIEIPPKTEVTPILPNILKPSFSMDKSSFDLGKLFNWKYTPSFTAVALDIKGKMPTLPQIKSGLVLRPILR